MKTNAFTLLEMLLVLSISLTMITLTIFPISNSLSTLTEKQLLEEIKATIYYAQLYAITSGQDTMITFSSPENQLAVATMNNSLITVPFSNSLKLNPQRLEKFCFSGSAGSINRFTTVRFIGKANNYKLIFQIGKGRFRIEPD